MISIFDLYDEFIGTVNTHQGGHAKPNRNFLKWANSISLEIFKDMCEEYQKSQVMSDDLTIFLKSANVLVPVNSSLMWDIIKLPPDYQYFASARMYRTSEGDDGSTVGCEGLPIINGKTGCVATPTPVCGGHPANVVTVDEVEVALAETTNLLNSGLCELQISKISTDRWAAICKHVNLRPTITSAKITQYDQGFKLAPKGMGTIVLDYFRRPLAATFEYSILNPGLETEYIQYDAATSQKLEWKETMIPEFLARLQKKYGRFVREPMLEQAGKDDIKI